MYVIETSEGKHAHSCCRDYTNVITYTLVTVLVMRDLCYSFALDRLSTKVDCAVDTACLT